MSNIPSFAESTREYEAWLGQLIQLNRDELDEKHERMREDPFEFMRGSFYRWAQLWRHHSEKLGLDGAPEVLGVGDLHIENFGTWRDLDGRLAWGVNDFDEACPLPYLNDPVRLAASVALALKSDRTAAGFRAAVTLETGCKAILKGYTRGMERARRQPDERRPFVLAEKHAWLRAVVLSKLGKHGPTQFDKILEELREGSLRPLRFTVPPPAREALLSAFPTPMSVPQRLRLGHRTAGLGSLGRQRFTAVVDDWNGGLIAREAKALAPSAWLWAHERVHSGENWYATALHEAVRAPDPWIRVHEGWVVRRLAPDAGKVKLEDLPQELDDDLLCAMGEETANVHSWSRKPLSSISKDLNKRTERGKHWFREAVERMAAATEDDWKACRKDQDLHHGRA